MSLATAAELAARAGLPGEPLIALQGGTNSVWRVGSHFILRIRPGGPDVVRELERIHDVAGIVSTAAPLVRPAGSTGRVVSYNNVHATLWLHTPGTQPLDYEAFGASVRRLHDDGANALRYHATHGPTQARELSTRLPHALDTAPLTAELAQLREHAHITAAEHQLLTARVQHVSDDVDQYGYQPHQLVGPALIHDDLRAKNVLTHIGRDAQPHVTLLGPDSLAWGPREYDLAFLVRGRREQLYTDRDLDAFASGYGAGLPEDELVDALSATHQLRWLLNRIRIRTTNAKAADFARCELERLTTRR